MKKGEEEQQHQAQSNSTIMKMKQFELQTRDSVDVEWESSLSC